MPKKNNENELIKYTAVMYTDGSASPNPGAYGGGCHGYLYTEEDYKNNGDKPPHYTVTDSGYMEAHELQPEHKSVKPSLYFNAVYPYGINGTNNQAELSAVSDTINIIVSQKDLNKIIIYTDSKYVIGVYNKISKDLTTRAWKQEYVNNVKLIHTLADTLVAAGGIKIELRKIAAHGTAIGNNTADRLAYAAREMGGKGRTDSIYKWYVGKYWKDNTIPHPMLNFKQVYFNTGIMPDTSEHIYVIMDYPKDVELGNKSSEPLFGISIFKEPVSAINALINYYTSCTKGLQYMAAIDLRVLYTQTHKKMTELLGVDSYNYTKNRRVGLLEEDTLVTPITPPGLAQKALGRTLDLYKQYKRHIDTSGCDDSMSVSIDITNQLYDVNEKGKFIFKYSQNITGPTVFITLDENEIIIPLVYGKDILTRNQLVRVGTHNPKIFLLVTRRTKKMFEYSVLIDTKDAIGVYCNYYICKVYL